jgi:predicted  nucleic acid-binding Zn-ribbon protein
MNELSTSTLMRVGVGIIFSLVTAGCATSSDLEKFNLDLSRKLDAQTKTLRAETSSLRDEAKSFRSDIGSLRAQIGTFHQEMRTAFERLNEQEVMADQIVKELNTNTANTRKAMEGYGAKSLERFGKLEAMTGEGAKQIQAVQHAVSDSSGKIEQLPTLVTTLGTEIRSLTSTMLGSYELEEGALKGRLQAIEQIKKRLGPLEASQ